MEHHSSTKHVRYHAQFFSTVKGDESAIMYKLEWDA